MHSPSLLSLVFAISMTSCLMAGGFEPPMRPHDIHDPMDPMDPGGPMDPSGPSDPLAPSAPKPPTPPSEPTAPRPPKAPEAPEAPEAPHAPDAPNAPSSPKAPRGPDAPNSPLESQETHESRGASHLLKRIEKAGKKVHAITGDITYRKSDSVLGRTEIRTGNFAYESPTDSQSERMGVMFDQLIVNNVRRERHREYLFDGTWLTELDHRTKTAIRRQLAPEGQVVSAGGPIPMLFSYSKSDLERQYRIEQRDPLAHKWTWDLVSGDDPVFCLRFIPREGTSQSREFSWIDVVFNDTSLIPEGMVQESSNGDRKTVRLTGVKREQELAPDIKKKLSQNMAGQVPSDWKLNVEPLTVPTQEAFD